MKVTANNKRLDIKDFGVELSNTALKIDSLTLKYDSLPELPQMTENVRYDGFEGFSYTERFGSFCACLVTF